MSLVAVGFTLVWETSQTINFAHGEFGMLPAFFILSAMSLRAAFWLAALISIALAVIILGLLFKIVGVLDNLSAAYISAQYRGAFPLLILIAVIMLRPHGLLGRPEERTV